MSKEIQENLLTPEPITRQVPSRHERPWGGECVHDTVETFSYVPHREIVRVKSVCPACGWVDLRIVPEVD